MADTSKQVTIHKKYMISGGIGPIFGGKVTLTPVYTAIYRRRWGCETALQGARLRLSRAYLAAGGDARHARGAARTTFDPGDADHFAAAASPVLRGLPAGQRD